MQKIFFIAVLNGLFGFACELKPKNQVAAPKQFYQLKYTQIGIMDTILCNLKIIDNEDITSIKIANQQSFYTIKSGTKIAKSIWVNAGNYAVWVEDILQKDSLRLVSGEIKQITILP